MGAAIDYTAGGDVGYTGPSLLPGDITDTAQVGPFVQTGNGEAWWEGLIKYGVTRAVDNRFGPQNVGGNTQTGSYAGQNGRTYSNAPNAGAPGGLAAPSVGGLPTWAVIGGAVLAAWLAFRS